MSKILAAIPAFNEAKTIGSVVLATRPFVDEVAVIDDGSTDNTGWIAEQAGATVIRHRVNRGYGAAIRTCFDYARTNGMQVLVILDGDGQHRPEAIPRVVEPVAKGAADVAIGSRFLELGSTRKVPRYRRVGISVLTTLTNLKTKKDGKVRDAQSGFRAYSRQAVDLMDPRESDMGASAEILWDADKRGLKVVEVPIEIDYDVEGSTKGPVRHALGVIVSMLRYIETEHALLVFGIPGLVLLLIGIGAGVAFLANPLDIEGEVEMEPALFALLLVVAGMMFSFTGLILHAVINATRRMR